MKMNLTQKVVLALSGVWVAALLIQASIQFRQEWTRALDDAVDDGRTIGGSLASWAQQTFDASGVQAPSDQVEFSDALTQTSSRLVRVDDDDGLPVEVKVMLARGLTSHWQDDAGAMWVATPVTLGAQSFAVLVRQDLSVRREHLLHVAGLVALVAIVSATLSLLLAKQLGHWLVGRPVDQLRSMAQKVGAGEMARVRLPGDDELAQLGHALNTMASQLEGARASLERETKARIETLEGLRHADRLATVGMLAAGIAHELGTPLNVIQGRAKMISSGEASGDDAKNGARIIGERAFAMTLLIRQLLDFARRKSAPAAPLDAHELLRTTAVLLEPMAKKNQVSLAVAPADAITVKGESSALLQVMSNLVVNAIQALATGGDVTLSCAMVDATPPPELGRPAGRFARLEVKDSGPGIADPARKHLFEPFFTTKDVGEGTGLGLAVAWGIARDHDGWIGVESRPGEGARFQLFLPPGA